MYAGFQGGTKLLAGDFNGDGKDDILRQEKSADGVRDVEIILREMVSTLLLRSLNGKRLVYLVFRAVLT
ncbi:hypothetical protein PL9631_1230001 [Planktothrix paucivesiculata PCC 9631]|uniref:Uncharacterized protein n=2 Tax=Planktothrix TaxID=54304 RepID=A0A7Z9BJD5_9CYAN|nr:hypothetical protein PL9631_1230001 [Planktothrix paucivesiculata PCC 9631]